MVGVRVVVKNGDGYVGKLGVAAHMNVGLK